tara:strand:+ start:118 stop:948 length:831 start_codon:yes stop_codon:yes gene_type:complete
MVKEVVEGIILVLSCNKYLRTRLKKTAFRLKENSYENWKVVYVIGNLTINEPYQLHTNLLTLKCEDSYIHLFKKLVKALEAIYSIYDIKQGVLRTGDDLIFNETELRRFLLKTDKSHFIGRNFNGLSIKEPGPHLLTNNHRDTSMYQYYMIHKEDVLDPLHNLRSVDPRQYIVSPKLPVGSVCAGPIFYLSNRATNILMEHFKNVNYDVFTFNKYSSSYPYTMEDIAVAFILCWNRVSLEHNHDMFSCPTHNKINEKAIAFHACVQGGQAFLPKRR